MKTWRLLLVSLVILSIGILLSFRILPESTNQVRFAETKMGGQPTQSLFIAVFGEQDYPFQFTLRSTWDNKVYQGSYYPNHGFDFIILKFE